MRRYQKEYEQWKMVRKKVLNGLKVCQFRHPSIFPEIRAEEEKAPTISGEKTMLWHQILEHIREKGLQVLHGKGMVEGMSNFSLDFDLCEHSLYGKQNCVIFSSSATRVKGILQFDHNDAFGPMSVPSLGKSVYYVSFINDFLRNAWIYFLRNKYEVFDKFKEFMAPMDNQMEKRIKVLRTDNGGEFCGNEFEELCKKCVDEKEWKSLYQHFLISLG
jgi:hypothetical protein